MVPSDVDVQLGLPHDQVAVTFDLNLLPLDGRGFARTMALAQRCGFLSTRPAWRYLPTTRGTVLWALLFAARLGYREVVLCGIDLHGPSGALLQTAGPRGSQGVPASGRIPFLFHVAKEGPYTIVVKTGRYPWAVVPDIRAPRGVCGGAPSKISLTVPSPASSR